MKLVILPINSVLLLLQTKANRIKVVIDWEMTGPNSACIVCLLFLQSNWKPQSYVFHGMGIFPFLLRWSHIVAESGKKSQFLNLFLLISNLTTSISNSPCLLQTSRVSLAGPLAFSFSLIFCNESLIYLETSQDSQHYQV